MIRKTFATIGGARRDAILGTAKGRSRPSRKRLIPGAESLEIRSCPSTLTAAPASAYTDADRAVAVSEQRHVAGVDSIAHSQTASAHEFVKKAKPSRTLIVHVKPGGKSNSLETAIKNAKPGTTIMLAPGTYTQNLVVKKKTNLTIVGAAGQTSILAPANGDALSIVLSNNITVENIWFRSAGSTGRGVVDSGSSVTLDNVRTDGTEGDGAFEVGNGAITARLTANSSQFDGSRIGDGLNLRPGSVATINDCTFNGNGTSPSATTASDGLVVGANAQATVFGSQFSGNTNAGLVALLNGTVTVQQSTFSHNQTGDGAIFLDQSTTMLFNNLFEDNGEVPGEPSGLNGLEFFTSFTGTAVVSGNTFENNTANGIWIGSAPNQIQIVNNLFEGNVAGVCLDASVAPVSTLIEGNVLIAPAGLPQYPGSTIYYTGLLAFGSGVSATIGGSGAAANTFENYLDGDFIVQQNVSRGVSVGLPDDTILTNAYLSNGVPVDPADAITPAP